MSDLAGPIIAIIFGAIIVLAAFIYFKTRSNEQ